MKKLLLTQLMLLLFASVFFLSCGDDDEGPQILLPELDGFYVYGTNTIAEGPSEPAAKMILAILDKDKLPNIESKAGVFGKFMYIGGNSTVSFVKIVSKVGTTYGATDGGSEDNGLDIDNVPVDDIVVNGTLVENAEPIHVTTEGLYYVFADTNSEKFVFMQIKPSMIGPATPLGWDAGTPLPVKSVSKETTVFEASIPLKGADGYRYKLNDKGWHAYQEEGTITTLSSLGVPDYGVAWGTGINDVGIHISNMPNKEPGIYTVTLTYTAATNQWKEVKTKTGNLKIDYTNFNVGIIGDATAAGTFAGDGTGGYELKKPTKAGNVFTWKWDNAALIADKEFIFLQNATWGGLQIDYLGATVSGNAITNTKIIDATASPVNGAFHNFRVVTGGSYNITLVINADTEVRTVTITE